MAGLGNISIMVRNYKCFGPEGGGYERLLPINLIIGRNNSGKSTLLDLLEYVCEPKDFSGLSYKRRGEVPQILLSDVLNEQELRKVFSNTTSGGPIPGNHWEFGKQWMGKRIDWEVTSDGGVRAIKIDPRFDIQAADTFVQRLAELKMNPFRAVRFKRLLPNRDILPEPDDGNVETRSLRVSSTRNIRYNSNPEIS